MKGVLQLLLLCFAEQFTNSLLLSPDQHGLNDITEAGHLRSGAESGGLSMEQEGVLPSFRAQNEGDLQVHRNIKGSGTDSDMPYIGSEVSASLPAEGYRTRSNVDFDFSWDAPMLGGIYSGETAAEYEGYDETGYGDNNKIPAQPQDSNPWWETFYDYYFDYVPQKPKHPKDREGNLYSKGNATDSFNATVRPGGGSSTDGKFAYVYEKPVPIQEQSGDSNNEADKGKLGSETDSKENFGDESQLKENATGSIDVTVGAGGGSSTDGKFGNKTNKPVTMKGQKGDSGDKVDKDKLGDNKEIATGSIDVTVGAGGGSSTDGKFGNKTNKPVTMKGQKGDSGDKVDKGKLGDNKENAGDKLKGNATGSIDVTVGAGGKFGNETDKPVTTKEESEDSSNEADKDKLGSESDKKGNSTGSSWLVDALLDAVKPFLNHTDGRSRVGKSRNEIDESVTTGEQSGDSVDKGELGSGNATEGNSTSKLQMDDIISYLESLKRKWNLTAESGEGDKFGNDNDKPLTTSGHSVNRPRKRKLGSGAERNSTSKLHVVDEVEVQEAVQLEWDDTGESGVDDKPLTTKDMSRDSVNKPQNRLLGPGRGAKGKITSKLKVVDVLQLLEAMKIEWNITGEISMGDKLKNNKAKSVTKNEKPRESSNKTKTDKGKLGSGTDKKGNSTNKSFLANLVKVLDAIIFRWKQNKSPDHPTNDRPKLNHTADNNSVTKEESGDSLEKGDKKCPLVSLLKWLLGVILRYLNFGPEPSPERKLVPDHRQSSRGPKARN